MDTPTFPIEDFDKLEKLRKGHLLFALCCTAFMVLAIVGIASILQIPIGPQAAFGFLAFITLIFGVSIFSIFNTDYRKQLKKRFLETIGRQHNLSYFMPGVFSVGQVYDHKIIPAYDSAKIEDGFTGMLKHVPFEMQEVHLENIYRDSEDRESRTTIFRGLMIRIGLKKRLDFHTIVFPIHKKLHWLSPKLIGFKGVGLPAKFEKKYNVRSTHQVESRVIFDPAFMERFLELCEYLDANNISASFKDSELFMMIEFHKNHFELGHIFRSLNDQDILPVMEELQTFTQVVDILKLNPYTGL